MGQADVSPALTPAQRVAWLRLLRTDNVGPVTFRNLLNRFGSAEAAISALPGLLKRTGKSPSVPSISQAEDEIAGLARYGARMVASCEPDYPALLLHIDGPPPLLSMAGGINLDWSAASVLSVPATRPLPASR